MGAASTESEFDLALWDPEDDQTLAELLAAAAETHQISPHSVERGRWKMAGSPWGPTMVVVARHRTSGRVAGVSSYAPYRLAAGGDDVLGAVGTEAFVHPDFQRRGLYKQLLGRAEEEATAAGAVVAFAMPNVNSLPTFRGRGFEVLDAIGTLVCPLRPVRVARHLPAVRRNRGTSMVPDPFPGHLVDLGGVDRDDRWQPLRRPKGPIVQRRHDPEWLRWRVGTFGLFHYEMLGSGELRALVRLGNRWGLAEAQIMEIYDGGGATRRDLVPVLRHLRARGTEVATIYTGRGGRLARWLAPLGFAPVPHKINFVARRLDPTATALFDDAGSWAFSGLDVHTW